MSTALCAAEPAVQLHDDVMPRNTDHVRADYCASTNGPSKHTLERAAACRLARARVSGLWPRRLWAGRGRVSCLMCREAAPGVGIRTDQPLLLVLLMPLLLLLLPPRSYGVSSAFMATAAGEAPPVLPPLFVRRCQPPAARTARGAGGRSMVATAAASTAGLLQACRCSLASEGGGGSGGSLVRVPVQIRPQHILSRAACVDCTRLFF